MEPHPFKKYIPKSSKYLLLGSFVAKREVGYNWFYSNKRNQFWPILREVYSLPLNTISEKKMLCRKLKLGIADLITECDRVLGTSADTNLINIKCDKEIEKLLLTNKIEKIFFSSRFVEKLFFKTFPNNTFTTATLPSPSPRYAKVSFVQKVKIYQEILPRLV